MRSNRYRRGFVLATVFFIMVVVILIVSSLFRLVPQEVRWAGDHKRETFAYYACTGGVKHALSYIKMVRTGKTDTDLFSRSISSDPYESITEGNPARSPLRLLPDTDNGNILDTYFPAGMPVIHSKPGRIHLDDDWNAEVWIFPDKHTQPHPFMLNKSTMMSPCYIIVAAAFRDINGNGTCDISAGENYALRVETSVVEGTFARYAYFVDRWKNEGADTTVFRVQKENSRPLFDGPVHSNDTPVIDIADSTSFWGQLATYPAPFGGDLSFSGDIFSPTKNIDSYDGVGYFKGNFNGSSPNYRPYLGSSTSDYQADPERYKKLFRQGQSAIRRTSRLPIPDEWQSMAKTAWGSDSGREVAVGAAATNQVYVNTNDLGIVSTGALRELKLDIVDDEGKSKVFDSNNKVIQSATSGHPLIQLQQMEEVTFVRPEPVSRQTTTIETGSYTMLQTFTSATPLAGYSPVPYQATTGHTTQTVTRYAQTGTISVTIVNPRGGGGPAAGGGATVVTTQPQYGEVEVQISVPITEEQTHYIQVTSVTGDGTHEVYGTTTAIEDVTHSYAPQDAVIAAIDGPMYIPINYFASTYQGVGNPQNFDYPTFMAPGELAYNMLVPKGKSLIVHQDRGMGSTFSTKLVDGVPGPVVGVFGKVQSLHGVNRGGKSIIAWDKDSPDRLSPSTLANVTIDDHLLQYSTTQGSKPSNGNSTLGIIGANIILSASSPLLSQHKEGGTDPLYLYASLFAAQGSFKVVNPAPAPAPRGLVRIVGGVIQSAIGPLIINNQGWSSEYIYDEYLNITPPPVFPPDGRFNVTFYRVTGP